MLHFDLNVSILLKEYPFLERFDQAARLGFGAVEFWWPAGEDLAAVARRIRDAGLRVARFNLDTGDMPAGDRGLLNDPDRRSRFRANLHWAAEQARSAGITLVIEALNEWENGPYLFTNTRDTLALLDSLDE